MSMYTVINGEEAKMERNREDENISNIRTRMRERKNVVAADRGNIPEDVFIERGASAVPSRGEIKENIEKRK